MTGPIHNSAIFVLGGSSASPALAPPSPPSPGSPVDQAGLCGPIEQLDLNLEVRPNTPTLSSAGSCHDLLSLDTSGYALVPQSSAERLASGLHVLDTEAKGLRHVAELYTTNAIAQQGFDQAVEAITRHKTSVSNQGHLKGFGMGKLVIIGVGKSGHIAKKLVATFNSLGLRASFLHPTEALHGDLGHVGPRDTFMLVTYSGKTPELSLLMPHLDPSLPLIILTSHTSPHTCDLIVRHRGADQTILLPAPAHESETVSFGVSAPTTSTTVALAVGDALAVTCARELNPSIADVFAKNHPGGAIGAAFAASSAATAAKVSLPTLPALRDRMISIDEMAYLEHSTELATKAEALTGGDILLAAYNSKNGWVRVVKHGQTLIISQSQIRRIKGGDLARRVDDLPWLTTNHSDCVPFEGSTSLADANIWLRDRRRSTQSSLESFVDGEQIEEKLMISVLDNGIWKGILETEELERA